MKAGATRGAVVALLICLPFLVPLSQLPENPVAPSPMVLVVSLALACGAVCGTVRARAAGGSVLFVTFVWMVGLAVSAVVTVLWPYLIPFGRFLNELARAPDRILGEWLQLAFIAAALDVSLEALCMPSIRRRVADRFRRAGTIGLVTGLVYACSLLLDAGRWAPFFHLAAWSSDADLLFMVRMLSGFCLFGTGTAVLATAAIVQLPADGRGRLQNILLTVLPLWVGFAAYSRVAFLQTLLDMPWTRYRADFSSLYDGQSRTIISGMILATVFLLAGALTRTFAQSTIDAALQEPSESCLRNPNGTWLLLAFLLVTAIAFVNVRIDEYPTNGAGRGGLVIVPGTPVGPATWLQIRGQFADSWLLCNSENRWFWWQVSPAKPGGQNGSDLWRTWVRQRRGGSLPVQVDLARRHVVKYDGDGSWAIVEIATNTRIGSVPGKAAGAPTLRGDFVIWPGGQLYNWHTQEEANLEGAKPDESFEYTLSSDGTTVAGGSTGSGTIKLWDCATGRQLSRIVPSPHAELLDLGRDALAAYSEKVEAVIVYALPDMKPICMVPSATGGYRTVSARLSDDTRWLAVENAFSIRLYQLPAAPAPGNPRVGGLLEVKLTATLCFIGARGWAVIGDGVFNSSPGLPRGSLQVVDGDHVIDIDPDTSPLRDPNFFPAVEVN